MRSRFTNSGKFVVSVSKMRAPNFQKSLAIQGAQKQETKGEKILLGQCQTWAHTIWMMASWGGCNWHELLAMCPTSVHHSAERSSLYLRPPLQSLTCHGSSRDAAHISGHWYSAGLACLHHYLPASVTPAAILCKLLNHSDHNSSYMLRSQIAGQSTQCLSPWQNSVGLCHLWSQIFQFQYWRMIFQWRREQHPGSSVQCLCPKTKPVCSEDILTNKLQNLMPAGLLQRYLLHEKRPLYFHLPDTEWAEEKIDGKF